MSDSGNSNSKEMVVYHPPEKTSFFDIFENLHWCFGIIPTSRAVPLSQSLRIPISIDRKRLLPKDIIKIYREGKYLILDIFDIKGTPIKRIYIAWDNNVIRSYLIEKFGDSPNLVFNDLDEISNKCGGDRYYNNQIVFPNNALSELVQEVYLRRNRDMFGNPDVIKHIDITTDSFNRPQRITLGINHGDWSWNRAYIKIEI